MEGVERLPAATRPMANFRLHSLLLAFFESDSRSASFGNVALFARSPAFSNLESLTVEDNSRASSSAWVFWKISPQIPVHGRTAMVFIRAHDSPISRLHSVHCGAPAKSSALWSSMALIASARAWTDNPAAAEVSFRRNNISSIMSAKPRGSVHHDTTTTER